MVEKQLISLTSEDGELALTLLPKDAKNAVTFSPGKRFLASLEDEIQIAEDDPAEFGNAKTEVDLEVLERM